MYNKYIWKQKRFPLSHSVSTWAEISHVITFFFSQPGQPGHFRPCNWWFGSSIVFQDDAIGDSVCWRKEILWTLDDEALHLLNPNVVIGWLLHYTENTIRSLKVKVNNNIEQWLLRSFQTIPFYYVTTKEYFQYHWTWSGYLLIIP